jgi:hypothetical protein
MKKKILNGILLVAALFATSSAFVSCKDNDADEINNARIEIQKSLNTQIADLKAQLEALNTRVGNIKECNCPDYTPSINELKTMISNLEALVKGMDTISEAEAKVLISTQVNALKDEILTRISLLTQALDKTVYAMVIEGTYNPFFGNIAVPVNMKSQVLAAYIGSDDMAEFHGEKIKKFYTGDAGTIYFTVNPNNVELDGKFSMVNSIGEKYSNVELSAAKKSDKVLTWGWNQTRANETGLYEVDVTVKDTKDIEFDYMKAAKDIKDIITKRDQASLSTLTSDFYSSLLGGKYQRLALKYDWSLTVGLARFEGSTRSPYDLAVMAVKPLSYDFEIDLEDDTNFTGNLEEIVDKEVDKWGEVYVDVKENDEATKDLIHSYFDNFNKRLIKIINSANKALQPTLLVKSGNKIQRATGTVDAGEITLIPTSYTCEIFAPAFKKFIQVNDETGKVYDGTVTEIPLKVEAGKTYNITYEAIDFFGKVRKNTYTITAK